MSIDNHRGNVVNLPRNGVRHTVGIPGTKLNGQPARDYSGDKITTLAEANIAIAEATFAKAALAFAKAEAFAPQMSEEQLAELAIGRAELAKLRLLLDHYRRAQRDAQIRRIVRFVFIAAVLALLVHMFH